MRSVRVFTRAVNKRLGYLITFPTTVAGLERNARYFENRSLIPNIVVAIDGTHIKVAPPKRDETSFYNRKSFHSVILQAVVDPRGFFMCIDVGFPGRMADPKVLRYTQLYRCAMQWFGRLGYYIYGDAAYPLRPWLMTGYRHNPTPHEELFNHYGSKARIIVEAAFGKLKGQWRCLAVGLRTQTPRDWKDTAVCCCVLHNITIITMGQGWDWDAGVVHGTDPHAFEADPNPVPVHPQERLRDDQRVGPVRDELRERLLRRLNIS